MTKISELPDGTTITGDELIPVVQDGVTVKVAASSISSLTPMILADLPTTDPHVANALWQDATSGHVLKVSQG